MDRDEALKLLPEGYSEALRLRDDGRSAADIAARLGVDEDVVATLLEIGDGKLRRVLAGELDQRSSTDASSERPSTPSLE